MIKFWTDQASCKFQPTLICRICSGPSAFLGSQGLSSFPPLIRTARGAEWSRHLLKEWREGRKKKERKKIIHGCCRGQRELPFCEVQGSAVRAEPWWQWCLSTALAPSTSFASSQLRAGSARQKTCNCFGNLNNIASLETPGGKIPCQAGRLSWHDDKWVRCVFWLWGVKKTLFSCTLCISTQEGTIAVSGHALTSGRR